MSIVEVDCCHPLRPTVEQHIVSVYRRAFDAEVSLFAPRLFAAIDGSNRVRCAAGIRTAEERFHSECYLDRPAERVAASALSRPVGRRELIEFTTLACAEPGNALNFVSNIVRLGREMGCGIALFTGTAPLRKLLLRAGLTVIPVTGADQNRVADPEAWGRYYDEDPRVCIALDPPMVPVCLKAPCFRSLRVDGAYRDAALPRAGIHA